MASTPRISVIVCSYNGASRIARTLTAVRAQSLDPAEFELLVVDDGSSDGTADVAAALGVPVIRKVNGGLAAARMTGVAEARGGLVAFTDDDCEPEPRWLEQLLPAFEDPTVGGVGGRIVSAATDSYILRYIDERRPLDPLPAELLNGHGPLDRLTRYLRSVTLERSGLEDGAELYSAVGANMAYRKEVIHAAGGFDPAFRLGGEEEEFCRRVHELGTSNRLVYADAAVVRHHFRPELSDTLRRARAYGEGHTVLATKRSDVGAIVFPFPLVAAGLGLVALARRSAGLTLLAALSPMLAYTSWLQAAVRRRKPELATYAYLQLAEETATMLGQLREVRARTAPSSSDGG